MSGCPGVSGRPGEDGHGRAGYPGGGDQGDGNVLGYWHHVSRSSCANTSSTVNRRDSPCSW